ncbi:hypothetical protein EXU85_07345 [Spirosoma sp. KCTC 42546]|uniref:hypothetical protein n=1 Tax=Spirosoma sp. KCTC 42546 TaxID=2520506 RepID=UPI0011598D1B|nr:hypothetical protein [Spirosoma sp. KCTC 42546]QDK78429.1 hypothetical protein EXU85_07345 [Spirosoma sp. KCTC 42546]
MRRQQIQPYLFVVGIALTLTACFNEPNYSNTPSIEFKGMFKYQIAAGKGVGQSKRDSVVITIGFKDGDGNLGIDNPSETTISSYSANGGWGNYEIKALRLVNKQYVEYPQPIYKTLFFPELTKGKPKGAIEGSLDFNQLFTYGTTNVFYPTKFQIRIRDRDFNASNVVETDTITLPYLN